MTCNKLTCNNCLHHDVCCAVDYKYFCGDFKDKDLFVEFPCKEGEKLYCIEKICGTNDGYKEEYKHSKEFDTECYYYDKGYDCDCCDAVLKDYCSINIDIYCDECKERFVVAPVYFEYGMRTRVFGTEMFNEKTRLEDILYLTYEQAGDKIKELVNKYDNN